MDNLERAKSAMFARSLPCNPKPFAYALAEHFDSVSIKSDDAKMVLYTLMQMAYGELATINLYEEYKRLSEVYENQEG